MSGWFILELNFLVKTTQTKPSIAESFFFQKSNQVKPNHKLNFFPDLTQFAI